MTKVKKNISDSHSSVNARKSGVYGSIAADYEARGICVFCDLSEQHLITESEDGKAMLLANRYPRSTGDMLVVPKRHVEHIEELDPDEVQAIHQLKILGLEILKKEFGLSDFYVLTREGADKTVKHYHTHVQPYWHGLIKWTPQEDLVGPEETAPKMREAVRKTKNGKS